MKILFRPRSLAAIPGGSIYALSLIIGVAGIFVTNSAVAETQIKIDFSGNLSTSAGGRSVYKPSPSEILDEDVSFQVIGGEAGKLLIQDADGPEGGGAMVVEEVDYYARSGLFVPPNTKLSPAVEAAGGYEMVSGITLEALVWIERFHPGGSRISEILGQYGSGGIAPLLRFTGENQDAPDITFITNLEGGTLTVTPPSAIVGAWHHIAGVLSVEGDAILMEVLLDGKSLGSKRVPRPEREASNPKVAFVPYRGFSIGESTFTAKNPDQPNRLFPGKIDAIAVTTDALDPATFVLPMPQSR